MQNTLRLVILTMVGLFIIWFMMMVVDIHIFLHTDADDIVFGTIPMNRTDIGDRCGSEYVNSRAAVDFKLSGAGEIIYLCPQGFSPIRSKVTAVTLSDSFRKSLTPAQQVKVVPFYPEITAPSSPTQPAATLPTTAAPATQQPMSNTPPPVENTSTPIPSPAPAPTGN